MGVPGLWRELEGASEKQALARIALNAFEKNDNSMRGLRIGIDASVWFFHAEKGQNGADPALRVLFFRLCRLLSLPVLPLFVFDGSKRPMFKRGKQIKVYSDPLIPPFKAMIAAFGFECRQAPGEAEAELAWLNIINVIDCVMTDDVDALVFGAKMVIRNWGERPSVARTATPARRKGKSTDEQASLGLRDNATSEDDLDLDIGATQAAVKPKADIHQVRAYRALDIKAVTGLSRSGLILVALMSGGDYDVEGLFRCGPKVAIGLAQAGLGESLIEAYEKFGDQAEEWNIFLAKWRDEVRRELKTNSRGCLSRKEPKLASNLPDTFLSAASPSTRSILEDYVRPLTSGKTHPDRSTPTYSWSDPDVTALASFAQRHFDWSPISVLMRFRSVLWPGVVVQMLRRNALENERAPWAELAPTPEKEPSCSLPLQERPKKWNKKDKKDCPMHASPKATRIANFFAKVSLDTAAKTTETGQGGRYDASRTEVPEEDTTSSRPSQNNLLIAIHSSRQHPSTGEVPEYRVSICPQCLVDAAKRGIDRFPPEALPQSGLEDVPSSDDDKGSDRRTDSDGRPMRRGEAKRQVQPGQPLRLWVPIALLERDVRGAGLRLCKAYRAKEEEKEEKKRRAAEKKRQRAAGKASKGSQADMAQATLDAFFSKSKSSTANPAASACSVEAKRTPRRLQETLLLPPKRPIPSSSGPSNGSDVCQSSPESTPPAESLNKPSRKSPRKNKKATARDGDSRTSNGTLRAASPSPSQRKASAARADARGRTQAVGLETRPIRCDGQRRLEQASSSQITSPVHRAKAPLAALGLAVKPKPPRSPMITSAEVVVITDSEDEVVNLTQL